MMMKKVLSDIRVLDFGRFVAGPYCGLLLADMGAEVIRVERTGGEEDRTIGLLGPDGQNVSWCSYARNKKAISLNLMQRGKSRELLEDLVRQTDVVIHSFTPKAAEMMGLSYDQLREYKPDIILTAISCFGSDGPYRDLPGFDFIAQAMSGAMKLGGYPDKPPIRAFMLPMDHSTGIAAAYATALAIRHRDQTGQGQSVDLSLLRTAISMVASQIAEADVLGQLRPIIGNRAAYVGPTDMYQCKDGYVFIATIMNSLWRRLLKVIGHEELADDPELINDLQRYHYRDRIDPLVAEWVAERTVETVMEEMKKAHIPCGPVLGLDEVSNDPHVQETGMVEYIDMEKPGLEKLPVSNTPFKMSGTPPKIERRAPQPGEHNSEIYGKLLGYSDKEMLALQKQRAI
jgi:crotonobetainyl-CoA:carnitine CoA-transferase CaiB-like acyl-CoA transferase